MNDPWIEIKQEIERYPHELWIEFMKLLPCERKNFFIPIPKKVFKPDPNIKVIVKGRQVGATTFPSIIWSSHLYPWLYQLPDNKEKHVICADVKDFWHRWNRFKKLKLFL